MTRALEGIIHNNGLRRCLTALTGPYVAIFTLHRPAPQDGFFNGISEELLAQCLDYARREGYEFVSLDAAIQAAMRGEQPTRPQLCFTLDDGYLDQVERLLPSLLASDAKPTLFVITDFADDRDWPWDAKIAYVVKNTRKNSIDITMDGERVALSLVTKADRIQARRQLVRNAKRLEAEQVQRFVREVEATCEIELPISAPEGYRPANWSLLKKCESKGLTIGSHSRSHNLLNSMGTESVVSELKQSKVRLSEELHSPSRVFCYPSGTSEDFARRHERLVKDAGYFAAVSTISRVAYYRDIRDNPYRVARIGFPQSLQQFARYASWLEALRSKLPL